MIENLKERAINAWNKAFSTGLLHIFGSSVINKIIGFGSSIVLVRIVSKAEYGIYTYADNILGFFTLATGLGVTSGILQLCSETKDLAHKRDIYRYGCGIGVLTNIIMAALILIIAMIVPLPIAGSNEILGMMCLLPLVNLLSDLQRTYLRTELRNKEFSYANTFNTILVFLFSCTFAYLYKARGLVVAHYLAAICTFFFIIIVFNTPFGIRANGVVKDEKRQMLNISIISMMNNGLSRLMYLLDIFVLGIFIKNDSAIASYKIATIIPTALLFIPSSIMMYAYPLFAMNRVNKKWVKSRYRKLTFYSGVLNCSIAIVLFAFAPLIITTVFKEQYLDALIPFRILSISFAFSSTFRIIAGNILVTQRKLKFNLYIAVFSSLFNTVLNVFLIRGWGSTGAAIATLITVVATSLINVWYLLHTINKIEPETII